MFDTLKIENRYTFKNDDELSIKSMSIYGDDNNNNICDNKNIIELENIYEEKSSEGKSSDSNINISLNEEKENISNNNKEEKKENEDKDAISDSDSVYQEKIEIIKNDNMSENDVNNNNNEETKNNEMKKPDTNDNSNGSNNNDKTNVKSNNNTPIKEFDDLPIISPRPTVHLTDTQYEILENIGNLCNHILSNSASKTLIRICHETPHEFQSVDLYIESLKMQSIYNFRLTARLFINDLFEVLHIDKRALDRIDEIGGLKIEEQFDGNLE